MLAVLVLHAVLGLAVLGLGGRHGRRSLLVGALAPAVAFLWALASLAGVVSGQPIVERYSWAPDLGLEITFRVDAFSLLMVLIVSGIGVLVMLYAREYFSERPGLERFTATLLAFSGAMLGLVTADNLLLLFVFWELTSITSYLLIGFEDEKAAARSSALQALLVTGIGGLALLAGVVVLAQEAGTYSMQELLADPPTSTAAGVGLLLVLLGAFTKSAQVPFHFWLPGAMAAPTPVSAYLHSATMVKAGVYLVARLAPAFVVIGYWRPLVVGVGLASMLLGGYRALRQTDLKLLLALGTVSQLGFMIVLFGIGDPDATYAGVAVLLAHSLFKAALFMTAGVVDHQAHTRDIGRLSGLGRRMPATAVVAGLAAASMAGVPALFGFVAKEAGIDGLLHHGAGIVTAGVAVGSILTVAYALRFVAGAFGGAGTVPEEDGETVEIRAPRAAFLAPAAVLMVPTIVWGLAPGSVKKTVAAAAGSLDTAPVEIALKAWPGIGTAFGISVLVLTLGAVVYALPAMVAASARATRRVPEAAAGYRWSLRALNQVADRVTGLVQPGSLPFYGGVILTTAVIVPGWYLVRGWRDPGFLAFSEGPLQATVAAIVVAAAVAIVFAPRRMGAVLLLGAVGYGVAVLFVIQGAPDLALTQMLIETLTLVVFVLVLRHLPERFEGPTWRAQRVVRLVVAGAVGVFVAVFTLVAASSRIAEPISTEMSARALPDAGGRNIVNVILTDFRALDTLGEITVLAVAALGILALVRAPLTAEDELESGVE
jgi:multicomponent Na+:H+ antiporter subunit A